MTSVGQLCLLVALVGSGYAAFACILGARTNHRAVMRSGAWSGLAGVLALSLVAIILAQALVRKDFQFEYVAQYSDTLLPWHYSLSAFWVGQAGSLLLWALLSGALAVACRFTVRREPAAFRECVFGVQMAFLCFLTAIMVFAADPMQPSLVARATGEGLSPLLQHPAMMAHPPIIFLGYAAWGVPFALAMAALLVGPLDDTWVQRARPWALFAWAALGGGILWGAQWAYEELGWGGYWNWDPVENGSLIPWLTGTAMVHGLMTWKRTGAFKKSTLVLAIATFALCSFATFLTRSGIFSSLHAFSQSPIGWLFLAWIALLTGGGIALVVLHRASLSPDRPLTSVWSRETLIGLGAAALIFLAAVVFLGTLAEPLSVIVSKAPIVVGSGLYNMALMPVAVVLLAAVAATPLLRWSTPPSRWQQKMLALAATAGATAAIAAIALGARHPMALAVIALTAAAIVAMVVAVATDLVALRSQASWLRPFQLLSSHRQKHAAFLIHLSFLCLAVGIAGSSLGTRRQEVVAREGETIQWAGRSIRYAGLVERDLPEKTIFETRLEILDEGKPPYTLLPARHLHRSQNQWTTRVAIHSTWSGDVYAIFHGRGERDQVVLTFLEAPLMRWLWLSGWLAAAGALIGAWPGRVRLSSTSNDRALNRAPPPTPHLSIRGSSEGARHGR